MATNKSIVNPTDQGLRVQSTTCKLAMAIDPALYGATAADLAELTAASSNFASTLSAHLAKQEEAHSARQLKDEARDLLAHTLRRLYKLMRATPDMTPALLTAADMPVADDTRSPIAAPTMVPTLILEKSGRLSHAFRVIDSENPTRRARPAGVIGFNLYYKVGGAAPTSTAECTFGGLFSRPRFGIDFPAGDGNKTVWYIVVAVTAKGLVGPMSETLEATIAA
jgi:hypothetical protein